MAVDLEVRDNVALITLRRPDQLNAIDADTVAELDGILSRIESDRDVRAVVITGEGKAFSAGADIKEFNELETADDFRAFLHDLERTFRRLEQLAQPSVAAVNGIAFGGGLELAMACDLRVADPRARFGLPEIKLGIVPGAGGTQRLPRLVPRAVAAQMLLTGDPVSAAEALHIGLVNEVVDAQPVIDRAVELAATIAARAPLAVAAVKRLLDAHVDGTLEAGFELERDESSTLFATDDRREGTAAFAEKREPSFEGR
jgi:enoyl-CoA hydratase/carnithine racemase